MKVITFSRFFPAKHPRKGQPTYFVEKICKSIDTITATTVFLIDSYQYGNCSPKHHTIRAGNRWKVGDLFSPRVWSGLPYRSKQIEIAPPIEIKNILNFEWNVMTVLLNDIPVNSLTVEKIAKNDGLEYCDFKDWFNIHPKKKEKIFKGQILCWKENISY